MRRYKCDRRWITVRFDSDCLSLQACDSSGRAAFYYAEDRPLYCEATIVAKRRAGSFRRERSTSRRTLRCKE